MSQECSRGPDSRREQTRTGRQRERLAALIVLLCRCFTSLQSTMPFSVGTTPSYSKAGAAKNNLPPLTVNYRDKTHHEVPAAVTLAADTSGHVSASDNIPSQPGRASACKDN